MNIYKSTIRACISLAGEPVLAKHVYLYLIKHIPDFDKETFALATEEMMADGSLGENEHGLLFISNS